MESFQLFYEKIYLSRDLAAAYEDACRKLGIDPLPQDADQNAWVRGQLATTLLKAAQLGECNVTTLSDLAVAFGMRNWHLPRPTRS